MTKKKQHAARQSPEAWKALHIEEVDYGELQRVLCSFFKWHVFLSATGDRFGDFDNAEYLHIHFDRKGIVSIVESNLGKQLLEEVELHVRHSLLDNQNEAAWQTICFTAYERVEGHYRYKDVFQILPVPSEAPPAPVAVADHPFLLQFSYVSSSDSGVCQMRKSEKIARLTRSLNVISRSRVFATPRYVEFFWGMMPDEPLRSRWLQSGYVVPNFSPEIDRFTSTTGIPEIQLQPEEQYFGVSFAGDCFAFPCSVGQYLDDISGLDEENAKRFAIASAWLSQARELTKASSSSGVIAMVSAIEALLEKQTSTCESCGQPKHSVTKRFKEFLEANVPGVAQQYPTELRLLYQVRSSLVHGGELLLSDLKHWEFLEGSKKEGEAVIERNAYEIAARALLRWVRKVCNPGIGMK